MARYISTPGGSGRAYDAGPTRYSKSRPSFKQEMRRDAAKAKSSAKWGGVKRWDRPTVAGHIKALRSNLRGRGYTVRGTNVHKTVKGGRLFGQVRPTAAVNGYAVVRISGRRGMWGQSRFAAGYPGKMRTAKQRATSAANLRKSAGKRRASRRK